MSANIKLSDNKAELTDDAFYQKFRKGYLSSYDFFRLFFAKLSLHGVAFVTSGKLKDFIYGRKNEGQYKELLADIHVLHNGVGYISKDMETNIDTLQMLGVLGRSNPSYETIINYYSPFSASDTVAQLEAYSNDMEKLVQDFISIAKLLTTQYGVRFILQVMKCRY